MGSRSESKASLFSDFSKTEGKKDEYIPADRVEKAPEEMMDVEEERCANAITLFIKQVVLKKDFSKIKEFFKIIDNKIDYGFLKKIIPSKLDFSDDKYSNIKVRFRLAGELNPPNIV